MVSWHQLVRFLRNERCLFILCRVIKNDVISGAVLDFITQRSEKMLQVTVGRVIMHLSF
jgi:hypothetical protein